MFQKLSCHCKGKYKVTKRKVVNIMTQDERDDQNNRANQMNSNNDAYWQSRGEDQRPEDWQSRSDD
jgi:hypothetical protein